ncbi:MAG: ATP-dependent sacrificial sulfur transferase LarE [Methanomicrobiales archaeon]|nr:ATP-dependent sacrificial sulfur transferase LarE [Methanomicrobiales archaeon]
MTINKKCELLTEILQKNAPLLIAYSGGVDSSLLAVHATDILGSESVYCVFIDGPEISRKAFHAALKQAEEFGLSLDVISGKLLSEDLMQTNPSDRCRYCKLGNFEILESARKKNHCHSIADGANVSDIGENRPGIDAFGSCGVIHPFIMAGITKQDIREIAKSKGLSFWNKPSSACLYSRIPYGDEITQDKLRMIEVGEDILSDLGISQPRVRHHGTIARIEVPPDEMEMVFSARKSVLKQFKKLGFVYITLDLRGYRSGSMDEVIL